MDRRRTASSREWDIPCRSRGTQRMLHSCGAWVGVPSGVEQIVGGQRQRVDRAFDRIFRLVEYKYVELGSLD